MDSTTIALIGMVVAFLGLLLTGRRDTRAGAANEAETRATLNSIKNGVDDLRVEIRTMRDKVETLNERLAKVEASAASAHKRIDTITNTKGE